MQCYGSKRNLSEAFGFGGPKVVRCQSEATKAVRIGPGVKVIDGWRPVCWICARDYAGWKVENLADLNLKETAV